MHVGFLHLPRLVAVLAPAFAGAQTKIDFFFPVPVDGKLAREMTRLTKVYNDSQKEVAVTAAYTGSYDDTKLKAQAAANAGKPPAVVLMSANFVLDLKLAGDVISLEPMLKADGTTRAKFLDDFWPAVQPNAIVDGELYAIPYQNSTPLLYFNVDHFKEAGLDPKKPPQTWAELVDAAKKLTRADRMGFGIPEGYDYMGWMMETLSHVQRRPLLQRGVRRRGLLRHALDAGRGAVRRGPGVQAQGHAAGRGRGRRAVDQLPGRQGLDDAAVDRQLSFVRENMKMAYDVAFVPRTCATPCRSAAARWSCSRA